MYLVPFDIRYDERTEEGTAELFHWREPELYAGVLYFHSEMDHQRWADGSPFRLINHWEKKTPAPRYDKAEQGNRKRK